MKTGKKTVPYKTSEASIKKDYPGAVIFDMDGTLVATTDADFMAWQKLFTEFGRELTFQDYFPLLGRKSQDVVQDVLNLHGEKASKAMARKMELFEEIVSIHGIHIMPNVEGFLKSIADAGIPMALATSSRKLKMQLVMEGSGLDKYFSVFVTGEEVNHGKPNPQIFLLAADKLGIPATRCIVLEDAFSGVAAAKAAGMKCVAIISTHEEKDLYEADLIIENFSQLSLKVLVDCMQK